MKSISCITSSISYLTNSLGALPPTNFSAGKKALYRIIRIVEEWEDDLPIKVLAIGQKRIEPGSLVLVGSGIDAKWSDDDDLWEEISRGYYHFEVFQAIRADRYPPRKSSSTTAAPDPRNTNRRSGYGYRDGLD